MYYQNTVYILIPGLLVRSIRDYLVRFFVCHCRCCVDIHFFPIHEFIAVCSNLHFWSLCYSGATLVYLRQNKPCPNQIFEVYLTQWIMCQLLHWLLLLETLFQLFLYFVLYCINTPFRYIQLCLPEEEKTMIQSEEEEKSSLKLVARLIICLLT